MKQLIITIAAVVLVGCGPSVDIHQACEDGNIEAVKQYLAAGWDVDAQNSEGQTPLHVALIHKNFHPTIRQIVELLIKAGADVNAMDNISATPLTDAIDGLKDKDDLQLVEMLIASGANVDFINENDVSPIRVAIFCSNKYVSATQEVIEILIKAGANVNIKHKDSHTPLHLASMALNDKSEIIELLIKNGAIVDAKNAYGATPLDLAKISKIEKNNDKVLRNYNAKTGEELKAEGK
jgi:ankyrin repeat protein